MTQADLAAAIGTAQTTVSQTENRIIWPSYDVLSGIADALDCSVLELFVDPDEPSLDALMADASPETRATAAALARALKDQRGGSN